MATYELCGRFFRISKFKDLESARIWAAKDAQIQVVFHSGEARSYAWDGSRWQWQAWHVIPQLPQGVWEIIAL